ncbi:phospho-N-acetylmuramoyl-pentapeptide-transferase [Alphaproteobacteria bacterium]|nr:phospho-N-acetylmuramoyl-pentapeptide-transferase [Alphaproteobacteria bacterium]
MLYSLLKSFIEDYSFLNIVIYLSFRSGAALITSLSIVFIFAPKIIDWLKANQKAGQPIREDGPSWHIEMKRGTPTMGGVIILGALIISTLLWADLSNVYIWIVLYITFGFGLIGFIDDYLKVSKNNHKGLSGRLKLIFQFSIVIVATIWIYMISDKALQGILAFPFAKNYTIYLGIVLWCIFTSLVVVGSSNAVNLTDGLDGLAIVPIIIAAGVFGIIAYLVGNTIFSNYLNLFYVEGSGELIILCSSLVGAGIGFLWFNAPPASVFMGDTGSLSTGAALGIISVITKHEIVLAIVGGLFVLEAVSVIVQVLSFQLTGKRIFKMAPLHHHFEKKGWSESTVVVRFWIIAVILGLIGLVTLKLR